MQIHTNTREMQYLADNFPDGTIVFPHFGSSPEDIFKRIAIVASHKNACIDISGSGIDARGHSGTRVKEIGSDRVLYGSDFTINEPSSVIAPSNQCLSHA